MAGSASCFSFQLKGEQGAVLLTRYPTDREDTSREGEFEKYTKKHYDSWVTFAEEKGEIRKDDTGPVLVTGVDKTRDFVMLCYSKDDDRILDCDFTTSGITGCGEWRKEGTVHTNHGPQPGSGPTPSAQAPDPTPSDDENPETISEQHVFIRFFTVRKRLLVPRVIKASAGPHELGGGGDGGDGSPLEAPCGSDQDTTTTIDTESDVVVHSIRAVRYISCSPSILIDPPPPGRKG